MATDAAAAAVFFAALFALSTAGAAVSIWRLRRAGLGGLLCARRQLAAAKGAARGGGADKVTWELG